MFLYLLTEGSVSAEGAVEGGVEEQLSCLYCHESVDHEGASTSHRALASKGGTGIDSACVTCHGEDVEHGLTGTAHPIDFRPLAGEDKGEENGICLQCHKQRHMSQWYGSGHESADLSCAGCHSIHEEDLILDPRHQAENCLRCHPQTRGEILKPYAHPIKENRMTCSECHQPHGGPGPRDLEWFTVTQSCNHCHPEKRGPFLWEHQPVSEDCGLCHTPHGSTIPGMLTIRGPHLCQRCHQPGAELNARHARLALGYPDPSSPGLGPGGGRAGISRFVLARNCMNCHIQVHGSNHPSGAMLER